MIEGVLEILGIDSFGSEPRRKVKAVKEAEPKEVEEDEEEGI